MELRKLSQVLVDVEDDGDADDQGNGKEIGANELTDDIAIKNLDVAERVQFLHPFQTTGYGLPFPLDPLPSGNKPFEMTVCPSAYLQSFSMFPDLCVLHNLLLSVVVRLFYLSSQSHFVSR